MIYRKPNDIFDFDSYLKGIFLNIYLDYINKLHLNHILDRKINKRNLPHDCGFVKLKITWTSLTRLSRT